MLLLALRRSAIGCRRDLEPGSSCKQVQQILGAASERRRAICPSGVRRNALGGRERLLRLDVDFENNWIRIVSREGAETKTGESHKVPIHTALKPILLAVASGRRKQDRWFFCEPASKQYPNADHCLNTKRLNEDFLKILKELGLAAGKKDGFTIHSLRSFFKTFCINAGVPREVVDIWQGHAPDRSASAGYYRLADEVGQTS